MSERRPFPPSPRRLALARQAGLSSASPLVVGAVACIAVILATVGLARAAAAQLGSWIAAACDGTTQLTPAQLPLAMIELAAPLLGAAAVAAFVAHVAQTRALWLPRRRIPGAPAVPRERAARAVFELCAIAVIGCVAFGWLWITAPRLARLVEQPAAAGSAVASLVVALAIAWLVIGVFDALLRRAELIAALAMTATEKREDERLAAADPRWRAQRLAIMRGPSIATAAVVLLGDDVAVAIAWDPTRQPVPMRIAVGRRARATQLVGLARRHGVPVHRDAELAARLVDAEGPVPDTYWPRLADVIAALRRR